VTTTRTRAVVAAATVAAMLVLGALLAVGIARSSGSDGSANPPAASTGAAGLVEVQPRFEPGGIDGGYAASAIGTVAGSECSVFPADNVWHSVIDGPDVPTVPADDPAAVLLAGATGPARATFRPDRGEGLNLVPAANSSVQPISVASNWLLSSNLGSARASDANRVTMGPAATPQLWLDLEAPAPGELQWTNQSLDPRTDNRLYVLDTEACVASEFIGFSGLLLRSGGGMTANRSSQFDLRSNNRRASRWWGEGPCPDIPLNPHFDPGCDGSTEKRGSARGGSGLSGVGGLVRFEEIESAAGIDHAIGVVLPRNVIGAEPVWPATESDGLGEPGTFAEAPEGAGPIPMGARLRLRSDFALDCPEQECPQATEVVRALKRHGMIVVDSMGPVDTLAQAGVHILGEMSPGWDGVDLRRIEWRADGTEAMRLSDFELIDARDMRARPEAGPQDDGWLQVR